MRLSVAMCTYFGKDYIRDQLLSIHRQTVPVDEIVICDDCSEDDTVEIIRKLTKQYDLPVRLFINEWNYGYKKNFEQAICRCTGDIIFLSDQDDTWIPTKVETIVNYFDRNRIRTLYLRTQPSSIFPVPNVIPKHCSMR